MNRIARKAYRLAALLVVVTTAGCLDSFLGLLFLFASASHHDVPLTVTANPDEAQPGQSLETLLTFSPLEPSFDPNDTMRTVSVRLVDDRGLEPLGVSASPTELTVPARTQAQASVRISVAPNAPIRPFSIRLYSTFIDRNPEVITHFEGAATFYLRSASAPAPRIRSVEGLAEPGRTGLIVFNGTGFDRHATFTPLGASPETYLTDFTDRGPGSVGALLTLPADARTGLLGFRVTTAGGESNRADLVVRAARPSPGLGTAFPNNAPAGSRTTVQVAGENLATGAQIVASNPSQLLEGDGATLSPFLFRQVFHPRGLPRTERVRINSLGVSSDETDFFVEPANFEGPRIRDIFIPGGTLIAGAPNTIELAWDNLTNDVVPQIVAPPNSSSRQPIHAATALRRQELAPQDFSVVILDVAEANTAHEIQLAAKTSDGLTTNLVAARVVPPDPVRPFLRRAMTGRVARGGEVLETLVGERLDQARGVVFGAPGLRGEIVSETATRTSIQVRIEADPSARLAGDAQNYIQLVTSHGDSNPVPFLVDPAMVGNAPILDTLAPNWGHRNNSGEIHIAGANFEEGNTVRFTPEGGPLASGIELYDSFNLNVGYFYFGPTPAVPSLGVIVSNEAGDSNTGAITLLNYPVERGPEPFRFSGSTVISGVRSQIAVTQGIALANGGQTTVHSLRTAESGDASLIGTFFPAAGFGVSIVGVMELDPYLPPGLSSAEPWFFLQRGDGLNAKPFPMTILPQPTSGPVARRVRISGELHRGTSRGVTIEGVRLQQAVELAFSSAGITSDPTLRVSDDGTEVHAVLNVAADAVLTGNSVTTLQVVTPAGVSNPVSLVVLP